MDIEAEYNRRVDAMTPTERLQRAAGMHDGARRILASQVIEELGELDLERLKWEVARRMYGECEPVRGWIEARLDRV